MNMQKTTPGGHFTVTIRSNVDLGQMLTIKESAESLMELSEMLTRASTLALEAAVKFLDNHRGATGAPVP